MRATLMPLRSNAAWFANEKSLDGLRRRLKTTLMLYDKVYLQDGRYQCTVQGNGSMDAFAGAKTLRTWDRKKISFGEPGKEVGLLMVSGPVNIKDLASGKPLRLPVPQAFFDADFYPLVEESGLRGHQDIHFIDGDWNQTIKGTALQVFAQHKAGLQGAQPDGLPAKKAKWTEVFILDSIAGSAMKMDVTMDARAASQVDYLRHSHLAKLEHNVPEVFIKEWLALGRPDFGDESWEWISKKRDSAAGKAYRDMLTSIENQVVAEAANLKSQEDVAALIRKLLFQEVVDELMERRTSPTDAGISLALNFTPVSLWGNVKECWQSLKEGRSWINFLSKKKP